MSVSAAIVTRGLSCRVSRDFAVRGVDLTVPEGAVYGLLGPNGSGKTTTLRLILNLLFPDAGDVEVLGIDTRRRGDEARRKVGFVPERPGVPDWMTVRRAMKHHAAFFPTWDGVFAASLLARLEIPGERPVRHLSKGQAGKLSLLLALAHHPALLVLDEPTDGLDPVARRDFLEMLMEYVADTGATVFVSSHLVHELERMADWIGVMDDGRLISETPLAELRGSIKRLRVGAGDAQPGLPFQLLSRKPRGREEVWVVRGWEPGMGGALAERGVELREVVDLDLEECYVELLRNRAHPEVAHVR